MLKKSSFRSKKFFNAIYLWITLVICLLVVIFSASIYFNVKKNVVENNYALNKQTLFQMKYNITYMNDTVKHLISSIYFGAEADYLLNVKETDSNIFDLNLTLTKMTNSIISNNPLIHSIYVYNNHAKTFLSTYNSMFYKDVDLQQALSSYKDVPILHPIVRTMQQDNSSKEVFTYAMYQSANTNGVWDGAVFVNVNADSIINNMKEMNTNDAKGEFFLLSDKGKIINSNNVDTSLAVSAQQIYADKIKMSLQSGDTYGYLIDNIKGENYFITYMYIEDAEWVIIKTQHLSELLKYMKKIQLSILIMTIIFLALSILVSFSLSKRIYKPIGSLVQRMRHENVGVSDHDSLHYDEIKFLNNTYSQIVEIMNTAQSDKQENSTVLKNYYLRNLLIDSGSTKEKEIHILNEHSQLPLSQNGTFVVCILKIDKYQAFKQEHNAKDIELYKYALLNIASETISKVFINESLDMRRGHFAVIIFSDERAKEAIYQKLQVSMSEMQNNMTEYLGLSISVTMGDAVENINEVSQSYHSALNYATYRYVYGRRTIITPTMVEKQNQNKELQYSHLLEKKLMEEMKSLNVDAAEETIGNILQEISTLPGGHIIFAVMQLIRTIMTTISEMNDLNSNRSFLDFNAVYSDFLELETIDEIFEETKNLLRRMISSEKYQIHQKHAVIVETIKDTIEQNYSDMDLSLQKLGSLIKMNPAYLGQIFKGQTGMSVASYINEVRILSAKNWLEKSNLTVSQIMEKVGIPNETSFYRLFKKKFGSTPKEYVLMKAIKEK